MTSDPQSELSVTPDPPQCPGCGYNLTGLPEQGTCPECGRAYDTCVWAKYVRRPLFGYALCLVPFFAFWAGAIAGIVLFPIGMVLAFPAPVYCIFLAWHIANRLARWRYSRAVAENVADPALQDAQRYITWARRELLAVTIVGTVVAVIVLGPTIGRLLACLGIPVDK